MRMRNKPWASDFLLAHPKCVQDPSAYKGKWKEHFGYEHVVLEIGSGKGDYWRSMAQMNPNVLWIALEKDKNVSAVALKKTEALTNGVWIVNDAANLTDWFEAGELDTIHLNFSDPWPKKGHAKRRLTSETYTTTLLTLLKQGGQIKFKTDNKLLFEYTILQWDSIALKMEEFSVDFRRDEHPEDAITEYEQHFMDLGQVIYRAVWRKV